MPDSFNAALTEARDLLEPPVEFVRTWPALLAALAFAICALALAVTVILAPPVQLAPAALHGAL